jgi:hypothetical protein
LVREDVPGPSKLAAHPGRERLMQVELVARLEGNGLFKPRAFHMKCVTPRRSD